MLRGPINLKNSYTIIPNQKFRLITFLKHECMNRILNEGWLSVSAKIIFRISLNNSVSVEFPVIGNHLTLSWPNGYVI